LSLAPGARLHAYINGLFRPKEAVLARELYDQVKSELQRRDLLNEAGRDQYIVSLAIDVGERLSDFANVPNEEQLFVLVSRLLDYEAMFELPRFDWRDRHTISNYWDLAEALRIQKALLDEFGKVSELIVVTLCEAQTPILAALPQVASSRPDPETILIPTDKIRTIGQIGEITEQVMAPLFDDDLEELGLFPKIRDRLDRNLIAASGGNPANPSAFTRAPKLPAKSDIRNPEELVGTYLGGTPLLDLFAGQIDFAIPNQVRFEHHHIVAGSGHGKTQTLQYLIAKDLEVVERAERSIIVIDSQGDLIERIANLKQFAPGQPLHDKIIIIDPSDVEYPVSLNLFDVGMERINAYPMLERERLTNSILELYDFVLGSLLDAGLTQKQSVIFRYVTRLMLHIPNATIHTLRELMEPGSEVKFAASIAKLTGTARHFFETEFISREFKQTKQQVLRRLWGILENQTFERMFSHPRSKLDLFAEMNAGKVILINTAKDLLKEQGTEIFGRFFIALIAQAAQERATLPENKRLPTFVYVDEAADYFDRNIGIILSQARKYNVGMILAHQYLGQLDPKLQEAFGANTSIKFAGGVSAKDARSLAPMLHCEPSLIETQPRMSFAAHIRGSTKSAIPLSFPVGHMEQMDKMSVGERDGLRAITREKYAVHYSKLAVEFGNGQAGSSEGAAQDRTAKNVSQGNNDATPKGKSAPQPKPDDPDTKETEAKPDW